MNVLLPEGLWRPVTGQLDVSGWTGVKVWRSSSVKSTQPLALVDTLNTNR